MLNNICVDKDDVVVDDDGDNRSRSWNWKTGSEMTKTDSTEKRISSESKHFCIFEI
jgi:DNA/RNA-binding domain of Phe-tRNA-synthetase-like protein